MFQLNRQEFRHRLARRVCHGRRGELTTGYRKGQEEKLGALGLVLNVIALWNAIYIQVVVETLQAQGHVIDPADLARISPLAHRHINFLGRYAFTIPEAVARGELRPLREPHSELGLLQHLMSVDRSSRTHSPDSVAPCSAPSRARACSREWRPRAMRRRHRCGLRRLPSPGGCVRQGIARSGRRRRCRAGR